MPTPFQLLHTKFHCLDLCDFWCPATPLPSHCCSQKRSMPITHNHPKPCPLPLHYRSVDVHLNPSTRRTLLGNYPHLSLLLFLPVIGGEIFTKNVILGLFKMTK
ncbi:unnamed protein product [Linum trigynum]|uniref:Uncharacterized protein n=1 Tax=Linum trigynum TaxID=586398 RepID=A0AAV2E653_9ROSI